MALAGTLVSEVYVYNRGTGIVALFGGTRHLILWQSQHT